MNILSFKPKYITYITRLQNNTNLTMFDPRRYELVLGNRDFHNKYISNNNDILSFDKQINDFDIISIVNDDYIINNNDNNTINLDTPSENISDMTLVNSTLEYTEIFNTDVNMDYTNQSIQNNFNTSYDIDIYENNINNKRPLESDNEDDYHDEYVFHKKIKLDLNQESSFDPILISDNVEIVQNDESYSVYNEENHIANSKLLRNPSFPIFTNKDINDTVISSFDPIFFSED